MFIRIFNTRRSRVRTASLLGIALLLFLSGNFSGCETEDWMFEVNCNDCYGYQPDSADLIIYVTIDAENDSVPLSFYKGNYENGEIDWQDTATTEEFYLYSELNRDYTVTATYKSGDKTVVAFDADQMYLKDGANECGAPCYLIKGGILDLRLLK